MDSTLALAADEQEVSDTALDGLLLPPGKAVARPQSCAPEETQNYELAPTSRSLSD